MKSTSGVKTTSPLPSRVTLPSRAFETLVRVSVSPSTSLSLPSKADARMVMALSSSVPALSATVSGASLTAVTVIVPASATELVPSPIV